MSEDRRSDSSKGSTAGSRARRIALFISGIGLLILPALALITKLNLPGLHTLFESHKYDLNIFSRDSEKPGRPDTRQETQPLAGTPPNVPQARIEPRTPVVPLHKKNKGVGSSEHTIDVVVRPRKRLARIPPEHSRERMFRDLEDRVERPEPKPEPKPKVTYTVAQRLDQYGEKVRKRLKPHFKAAGVRYPARAVTLVGLKKEGRLELYAGETHKDLKFIRHFPIKAASGVTGPKLRQGDRQVPEGLYRIVLLNPNSKFHLSLRVNYPNRFDYAMGKKDRRSKLGGDIMIHGNRVSRGCLAMGDEAAEDLFVLAADTGLKRMRLILSPIDFRTKDLPTAVDTKKRPKWTKKLYAKITKELENLPLPPESRTSRLMEFFNAMFPGSTKKKWPLY